MGYTHILQCTVEFVFFIIDYLSALCVIFEMSFYLKINKKQFTKSMFKASLGSFDGWMDAIFRGTGREKMPT